MNSVNVRIWPEGGESRILAALGLGQTQSAATPEPGQPELVEYEAFLPGVLAHYDSLVAGGHEDSPQAFRQFAETQFDAFRAFQIRWAEGGSSANRLVVPSQDFLTNPANWLTSVWSIIAPDTEKQMTQQEFDARVAQILAWGKARPQLDPTGFRHHDPTLFKHLAQLRLGREEVETIFQDMMGRRPSAAGAARLQYSASPDALRRSLSESQEFRLRHNLVPTVTPQREAPANPEGFDGFAAMFDRSNAALIPSPPAPEKRPQLRKAVDCAAEAVLAAQQSYQPLYGVEDSQTSAREALLLESCALLRKEFAGVSNKKQIRIVDVGCNAGFVSFSLAETFPNTLGLDVNADNIALCLALKAHCGSPAMFSRTDLLAVAEQTDPEFEAIDCILFLNVIHQLIFHKGVDYVKSLLGRLSRSVDFMVVELARPAEYVPFGKQDLLPLDPAEILSECHDATITLVKDGKRPVYTIRRRSLTVNGLHVPYSTVRFSEHPEGQVNRKYYYGADTFTKVMRYSALQGSSKFVAEVNGLQALAGLSVAPDLLAWDQDRTMGRVVMRRLYGASLLGALPGLQSRAKPGLFREVIRLAATMASRGICQNDFSVHNFILMTDGSLRMIDFELSGASYLRDPFAALCWVASDLLTGAANSYRMSAENRLSQPHRPNHTGQARIASSAYPEMDMMGVQNVFGSELATILVEARDTRISWNDFLQGAWKRLDGDVPAGKPDKSAVS